MNEDEDEGVLSGHFLALQTETLHKWYHRRMEVERTLEHAAAQNSRSGDMQENFKRTEKCMNSYE